MKTYKFTYLLYKSGLDAILVKYDNTDMNDRARATLSLNYFGGEVLAEAESDEDIVIEKIRDNYDRAMVIFNIIGKKYIAKSRSFLLIDGNKKSWNKLVADSLIK